MRKNSIKVTRYILIIFFSFLVTTINAQVATRTVSGKITDSETHEAVIGATCKAVNAQGKILTYATTDGTGNYKLQITDGALRMIVSAMGYTEQSFEASAIKEHKNISLRPETYSLKEVPVTVNPIEINKDTIKYNVSAFKTRNDKYLEDVLCKMPGIEVNSSGQILYKGESINQFNIEGQNLLGNRYNQATRNLPVDAVAQVQIVENDQPIRALKKRAPSKKATLNIKLRSSYKLRPFGETIFGGGKGYDKHTLWQNKLTLINIGRKQQMLLNASMNNNGMSLSKNNTAHINSGDLENFMFNPFNLLYASSAVLPPVSEPRYLRNKDITAGLNHLFRLGKYGSFRTNITYYGNSVRSLDSTSNQIDGAYSFNLCEANRRKVSEYTLNTELHYELNAPKVYLTNELSGNISSSTNRGELQSNSQTLIERVDRHQHMLQNKLSLIVNSGVRTYGINSITRYFKRNEWLDASIGHKTNIDLARFATRNTVNTGFIFLGKALDLSYTIFYQHDKITVDTLQTTPRCTINSQLKNQLNLSYNINYRRGQILIALPTEILNLHIDTRPQGGQNTYFFLSPSLNITHRLSPFLNFTLSGKLSKSTDNDVLAPQTYYRSYRTRFTPLGDIGWTRASSLASSVYYANLINMLTVGFTGVMTWSESDHYEQFAYTERTTEILQIWKDNTSKIIYLSLLVDKSFPRADLQIKSGLNFNRREILIAQNARLQTIKSNIATATLFFRYDHLKWITLSHDLTFNLSWQDHYLGSRSQPLTSFYQILTLSSAPLSKMNLTLQTEQNTLEIENNRFRTNIFIDATVQYVVSRRLELGLQLRNLLDRRVYEEVSFFGMTRRTLKLPLRGREMMLLVKLKL